MFRSFRKDASFPEEIERRTETVAEKLWNMSQSNGKPKNLLDDWDTAQALALEHGWNRQLEEVAKIWVTSENPEA